MSDFYETPFGVGHDRVFLGSGHERKTWVAFALLRRFGGLSHRTVHVHSPSEARAWR